MPRSAAGRSFPVPSRLTVAAQPFISIDPSGRPQIARTCWANWLVRQPSIVQ